MKTIILAGGLGTRLAEETDVRPKPMSQIGEMPIIWHIMKIYSYYGFYDFIICLGYKGYFIKEYFSNYFLHTSDLTFDFANSKDGTVKMEVHQRTAEPWRVTLIETGAETQTGGRVARVRPYLTPDEPFMMTYGDGVANVNIPALIQFHKHHGRAATVTAVQPPGRFGSLEIDSNNLVSSFVEKPQGDGGSINGGFFVLDDRIFQHIKSDQTVFEHHTLKALAEENQLAAYRHVGFWHPMDTLRDKKHLESLWTSGKAPWKLW